MGTLNIYNYDNAEDIEAQEPSVVVELSDDNKEIVSITASDPEEQAEAEEMIRLYMESGLTPIEAVNRYSGTYGYVGQDGVVPDDEDDDAVVSAVEDDSANNSDVDKSAERILSGALMAMANDSGHVVTLYRTEDDGTAMFRLDGEWRELGDPATLSNLSFVGVEESAVELYDEHQSNGKLVPIKFYKPSIEGPYWTDIIDYDNEEDVEDEDAGVTASIVLNSRDDLEVAIAAAVQNEDLRWFVERRVAALGLEANLPWLKD